MDAVADIGHVVVDTCIDLDIATFCAIEPHFELIATERGEFNYLLMKDFLDIAVRSIIGAVGIPRRHIEAIFHAQLASRFLKIAGNVCLAAIVVAGINHAVRGGCRGPCAKTIVVFDGYNAAPHSSCLHQTQPLLRIGCGSGLEEFFIFLSVSPFDIGKGVHSEMEKRIEFGFLPTDLILGRYGKNWSGLVVRIGKFLLLKRKRLGAKHSTIAHE